MPRKKPASPKKRGPATGSPGKRALADLYLVQRLSYEAIADRHGVTAVTVMRWVKAVGIPPRTLSEAGSNYFGNRKPTAAQLRVMYEDRKLSYPKIATECGVTVRAVLKWMREYDITPRTRSEGISLAHKGKPWTEAQREAQKIARSKPEYRRQQSERQKGEKAHNWQGGKIDGETLRMQQYEWRKRRAECYERDGWTCQDCGVHCTTKGKSRIQAHHLVSRREGGGDGLDNLVTLCASCHQKRERQSALRG